MSNVRHRMLQMADGQTNGTVHKKFEKPLGYINQMVA